MTEIASRTEWVDAKISTLAGRSGRFFDGDWVESKDQDPEGEVRLLQLADIGDGHFRNRSDRRVNREAFNRLGCTSVFPGDILIARMPDPIGRASLVPEGLGETITIVDVAALRCDPEIADQRYAMYAINSRYVRQRIEGFQDGATRQRIPRSKLGKVAIPLPPLREQQVIADFLDRETAKIDAVIEKQRALVDGLRGRRQAVIRRAILGRDKDAFKPVGEGSPWVREVPAEWDFGSLGSRYEVVLGKALDAGREARDADVEMPYVRAANIQPTGLDLSTVNSMPFSLSEASKYTLRAGDLLVVEGGSVGVSTVLEDDMEGWGYQNHVNRVRARDNASTHFLHYVLNAYRSAGVFDIICRGATISTLPADKLRGLGIPIPPPNEQFEIAAHMDRETARIDTLIARSERLIELSQERRSALITAAVTGQLDITSDTATLEGAA